MSWDEEPIGKALVSFADGMSVVKGDGTAEEAAALHETLRAGGCDEETAAGIARVLLAKGLTIKPEPEDDDPRTMGGETFVSIAEGFGSKN